MISFSGSFTVTSFKESTRQQRSDATGLLGIANKRFGLPSSKTYLSSRWENVPRPLWVAPRREAWLRWRRHRTSQTRERKSLVDSQRREARLRLLQRKGREDSKHLT